MDTQVLETLETLKTQLEREINRLKSLETKKNVKDEEETFVKELLKDDYIITNNENDSVPCAELCRYLAIKTDKYSPRKLDYILAKMLKTINKKNGGVSAKYKIGIKKIQCDID